MALYCTLCYTISECQSSKTCYEESTELTDRIPQREKADYTQLIGKVQREGSNEEGAE